MGIDPVGYGGGSLHLTDVEVEQIGLVRRPANRRPFYFVKSEDTMNEEMVTNFSDLLAELEKVEEVNTESWSQALGLIKDLMKYAQAQPGPAPEPAPRPDETFAELSAAEKKAVGAVLKLGKEKLGERLFAMLTKLAGDGYGYPEGSSDPMPEEFRMIVSQLREDFEEKLATERKDREAAEQKFAEERKTRRLREFTDSVSENYATLATGNVDQLAADLLALHDFDSALYERFAAILKAADKAVSEGALYEQMSSAGEDIAGGDPFLTKVEAIRKERFSDKDSNAGFAEALRVAMDEYPELASAYAHKH